jgi:hypothetical protein
MDAAAADTVEALKEEKMGPPGPCSSRSGSRYSMSRTCGPRDIISLVIPKVGDNGLIVWCHVPIFGFPCSAVEMTSVACQ